MASKLGDDAQRELFRRMLLHRQIDLRGFQLNRQGRIPFALGGEGHEAAQAGASLAFRRGRDILVPYYRDLGLALGIGLPLIDVFTALFAKAADRSGGRQFPSHFSRKEIGLVSVSSIIAAHVAHAVGIAVAMQYRKETGRAVLCSFGDGATSQGEWHESVNFAAVAHAPIVFFCQNNGWAISVPVNKQMKIENVADRAAAYGIPGETVDGFNPIAVHAAVDAALQRAREGGGPSIVEAKCYRFLSHTTDDDDRTYRSREEVEAHRLRDPLPTFEQILRNANILTLEEVEALKVALYDEIDEALEAAAAMEGPAASDLTTNVYEGDHQPWR
jgi:2-oxoisovalerate dehydrogenase E1 component alpha subunit